MAELRLNESLKPFSVQPLNTAAQRWDRWLARFSNFVEASNLTDDDRKKAVLLHVAGEEIFDIYMVRLTDQEREEATFDVVVDELNSYFRPRRNTEYEVYKFRKTQQEEGETIDQFYNKLLALSAHCNFSDRDREIKSQVIQACILEKVREKGLREDVSLADLLRFGRNIEATTFQANEMAASLTSNTPRPTSSTSLEVNKVRQIRQEMPFHTHQNQNNSSQASNHGRFRAPVADNRRFNRASDRADGGNCPGCGNRRTHIRENCPAWGKLCFGCGTRNHFQKACRKTKNHYVSVGLDNTSDDLCTEEPCHTDVATLSLYKLGSRGKSVSPYTCTLNINGIDTVMEIDTGSAVTLVNEETFGKVCEGKKQLFISTDQIPLLKTYSGSVIKPLGRITVDVFRGNQTHKVPLLIVPGNGPNLLGRDWLSTVQLDWMNIFHTRISQEDEIINKYPDLFKSELGMLKDMKVRLHLDDSVPPRVMKARTVPYSLREKVDTELERLQKEGVIQPVEFSDWASPIVPVLKPTGEVRICGDYKLTLNRALKVDMHPIPNIEDLYTKLAGGCVYSKLDLSHAYQQLVLDESSRKLTAINTSKGLFVYNRLCYGISAAPGIFQRTMEQLLQGIPHVAVYLDDIVVTGLTTEEHNANLHLTLARLESAGLRLKKKSVFLDRNQ
jgi:hypothetical protein